MDHNIFFFLNWHSTLMLQALYFLYEMTYEKIIKLKLITPNGMVEIGHNTVKPSHVVTCIERSPFSCPVTENFIWNEPLLRGHLSYKATFSLSQRWPLNTGLTVLNILKKKWYSILMLQTLYFLYEMTKQAYQMRKSFN